MTEIQSVSHMLGSQKLGKIYFTLEGSHVMLVTIAFWPVSVTHCNLTFSQNELNAI